MIVLLVTREYLKSRWASFEVAAAMQRPDSGRAILPVLHQVGVQEVLRTFPALADRQFFVLDERSTPADLADLIAKTLNSWNA
jgi:hypothetical protein